jgi:two-component system cell cycle sensor histidine kinase/response regulator CckA
LNIIHPQELPAVRANAAQLRQVILNLITNASEGLGEQEGVISITAARLRFGPSEGPADLSRGDYVRLEVSDTGCGMTKEVQSKIFDPFFTTKFAGRGMGLAVVKGVVRSHEGAINVVSVPGQGSRFEILLPCSREPAREEQAKPEPPARDTESSSGAILIVEDEHSLRNAVSKMLRLKGFTVFEAADGEAGASVFRTKAPDIDVVLLDLTLPGLSGAEVLCQLRQVQRDVTVIITSAYSREQAQTTLGARDHPWLYIRKPYQINELTDLLWQSIRVRRRVSQ